MNDERGKKEIDFSIMCLGFELLFSPPFFWTFLFVEEEVAVLCLPLDVLWSSLSTTKERSTLRATKRVKRRKRDHHHRCRLWSERDHHYLFLWLSSSPLVLPEDKAKKSEWSSSSVTQIISNLSVVLETLRKLFV